ncbi:hypothetical protein HY546_03005 [archaeon]|nr:hypothetical protein [archaeon]
MAIDPGTIKIVKDQLYAGKDPEVIVEKLRDLGYSDSEVEQIMHKCMPGYVLVIKRPSRPTVFKSVISHRSLALVLLIVLVVGGLSIGMFLLFSEGSVSDAAKRLAERTSEGDLFLRGTDLHNRVVGCMPAVFRAIPQDRQEEFKEDFEKLQKCTIKPSTRIEKLGEGLFNVTFRVEEQECGFHYVLFNDVLSVVVNTKSLSTESSWLAPTTFNQTVVNAYSNVRSCDALAAFAKPLASKLLQKQVP